MIKRFEHGGNIYQPAPDGGPWLDFSANINPLGLPESIRQALAAHLDAVVHYPDPAGTALRQALEGAYGVPGAGQWRSRTFLSLYAYFPASAGPAARPFLQ